jgi:hypothetical protein
VNMYHLVSQVIAYNVYGDLVEVGCYEGQSAVLIAKVLNSFHSKKDLHCILCKMNHMRVLQGCLLRELQFLNRIIAQLLASWSSNGANS